MAWSGVRRAEQRADHAEQRLASAQRARRESEKETAAVRATLLAEQRNHADRLDEIDKRFVAAATRVLNQSNDALLKRANAQLDAKSELAVGQFKSLADPIATSLKAFRTSVGRLESKQREAYGALTQQVQGLQIQNEALRKETETLGTALRRPETRGRWGEYQLQRVLEIAGMTEKVDFVPQESSRTSGGLLRPDVIVHLPSDKSVVIDSKTPLDAYLEVTATKDESARREALERHARQFSKHIRDLSAKAYWKQFESAPDFVVMFVPSEALYDAAARVKPELFEDALRKNVLITTPTTLIALLKSVLYGRRQERLAENAKQMAKVGTELYERFAMLGDHVGKLGKNLGATVKRYNETVGSLESMFVPKVRALKDLGAAAHDKKMPDLSQVDVGPRTLTRTELIGAETRPPQIADDSDGASVQATRRAATAS